MMLSFRGLSRAALFGAVSLVLSTPAFADPTTFDVSFNASGTPVDLGTLSPTTSVTSPPFGFRGFSTATLSATDSDVSFTFSGGFANDSVDEFTITDTTPGTTFASITLLSGLNYFVPQTFTSDSTSFTVGLYYKDLNNALPLIIDYTLSQPQIPSVTPEPSSLGLLGTGLLGVASVLRRRRMV